MSVPPSPAFLKGLLAAARTPGEESPSPLRQVGKYRIVREIARGAMGIVYEAEDSELRRPVALKVLLESLAGSEELRLRFQREALSAARISHPNVVRVYDAGEADGRVYLVMEIVAGRPLQEFVAANREDRRALAALAEKIARGVAAAHAEGIVHRDLKPANVLLTEQDEPKVGDFGLAHWIEAETRLTRSGAPLGTPAYMAPEQVESRGGPLTPATDVHALGAILYEMLTGEPPFGGRNVMEVYSRIIRDDAAPPRQRDKRIPEDLQTICLKALEKSPGRRYPDAREFADDLRRFLDGEPIRGLPPGLASRGAKWIRRHRTAAAVSAIVLLAAPVLVYQAMSLARRGDEQRRLGEATTLIETERPTLDRIAREARDERVPVEELRSRADAARRRIERAVALAPALPAAHYHLGRAWELAGDASKAEAEWRETIRLEPAFGPAHYQLGRWLVMKSYAASIASRVLDPGAVRAAARAIAEDAVRHIALARTDEALDLDAAEAMRAHLSEDASLADRIPSLIPRHEGAVGVEVLHWLRAIASPRAEDAFAALEAALKIHPRFEWAFFTRGVVHSLADQWEASDADRQERIMDHWAKADADFSRQLELAPRSAIAHVALARRALARYHQGSPTSNRVFFEKSLEDSAEALRREPGYIDAVLTRAEALRRLDRGTEAMPDYATVIAASPSCVEAWQGRAWANWKAGDRAAALRDFDEVLRLNPLRIPTYKERGLVKLELGDIEGAWMDAELAKKNGSGDPAITYILGRRLEAQGRTQEAAEQYREALRRAVESWSLRADAEARLRRLAGY